MKQMTLYIITFYRYVLSPLLKTTFGISRCCRYSVSCSEYAYVVVQKHGVTQGVPLAIRRLLSCQPFGGLKYV